MDYHPYTAYHISESLQLLLFTAVGFFLLLKKLEPEPKISLDTDWLYRMGGRLVYWLARKPVQSVDTCFGEAYRVSGLVPIMKSALSIRRFDNQVIDGAVDGLARCVAGTGAHIRQFQRWRVQESLAIALVLIGVALLAGFLFF